MAHTQKNVFTPDEWHILQRYNLANIRLLLTWRNLANEFYYSSKEESAKKATPNKENLWFKAIKETFKAIFKDQPLMLENRSQNPLLTIFMTAVQKVNNQRHSKEKERARAQVIKKLELQERKDQLFIVKDVKEKERKLYIPMDEFEKDELFSELIFYVGNMLNIKIDKKAAEELIEDLQKPTDSKQELVITGIDLGIPSEIAFRTEELTKNMREQLKYSISIFLETAQEHGNEIQKEFENKVLYE